MLLNLSGLWKNYENEVYHSLVGRRQHSCQLHNVQKKYEKLMADWHKLSTINRSESDKKYAEAQEILQRIEQLQAWSKTDLENPSMG